MKHSRIIFGAIMFVIGIIWVAYSCNDKQPKPKPKRNPPTVDSSYPNRLDTINQFIDSATAQTWIQRYIDKRDSISYGSLGNTDDVLPYSSEGFSRRYIQSILDLDSCIGVRIFLGINDSNKVRLILGGIDTHGNTLYITNNQFYEKGMKNRAAPPPPPPPNKTAASKGFVEMGLDP
jgi:hypothetical protein